MAYAISKKCTGCTACVKKCPVGAIFSEKNKLHCIDARVCIECGVCGKICKQEAVRDTQGKLCVPVKLSLWPKPVVDIKTCVSCNVCIEACPVSCLSVFRLPDSGLHGYPVLEKSASCISCGFCATECPVDAIRMRAPESKQKKNLEER